MWSKAEKNNTGKENFFSPGGMFVESEILQHPSLEATWRCLC